MIKGISGREDSFLIGFVCKSQALCAITMDEAHQWIYSLIKDYDDLPPYMYCLLDAKDSIEFRGIIGFPVFARTNEKDMNALIGISYKRGLSIEDGDWNISRKKALKALAESPQLEKRFRETFPFIEW
tara:strand:+ start:524 stop:907 length:384 start_codon:yes stop_codon:yes gene_type:complete